MSRMTKLTRPIGALTIAASLALTPVTATPAQAQGEELILGAIGALFFGSLAAAALSGSSSSHVTVKPAPVPSHGYPHPYKPTPHKPSYGSPHHGTPHHTYPKHHTPPKPSKPHKPGLPSSCAIQVGVGASAQTYYGQTCLIRNYALSRQLPNDCKATLVTKVDGPGRSRTVYNGACLARAGFPAKR